MYLCVFIFVRMCGCASTSDPHYELTPPCTRILHLIPKKHHLTTNELDIVNGHKVQDWHSLTLLCPSDS